MIAAARRIFDRNKAVTGYMMRDDATEVMQ